MPIFIRLSHALLLGVLAVLGACGGTVSGTGTSVSEFKLPDGAVTVPPTPGPTQLMGVYSVTAGTQELLSIATPSHEWYAVYFENPVSATPSIFSGTVTLGVGGAATIDTLRAFQVSKSPAPLVGKANILGATLSSYNFTASAITSAANNTLSFTSNALDAATYNLSNFAGYGDVQGTPSWQGTWYDGITSNQTTLRLTPTGTVTSVTSLNYCDLTSLALQPLVSANMFKVTLHIPISGVGGICLRTKDRPNGVDFNGIAVIYKSGLAGKSWRMDLIAVDSSGSGISFRGDR